MKKNKSYKKFIKYLITFNFNKNEKIFLILKKVC